MAKEVSKIERPQKFEHRFEDDECIQIWKYDLKKFSRGPISVETQWKAKYLKELEVKKRRGR
jgi:SOS response regulatory protein OraA/RecX